MLLTEFRARDSIPNLTKCVDPREMIIISISSAHIIWQALHFLLYYLMQSFKQPHEVGAIIVSSIVEEMAA